MNRLCAVLCLLTLALAGCAANPKIVAKEKGVSTAVQPETRKPDPSADSVTLDRSGSSQLSGAELETWNDPAFKKQYAESYIAATDIEPRVTVVEREQLQKILEFISADQMDEAATLLENNRGEAASAVFDFTLANIYF